MKKASEARWRISLKTLVITVMALMTTAAFAAGAVGLLKSKGVKPGSVVILAGVSAPTPTPTPSPTPTSVVGGIVDLTSGQLAKIASNFDTNALLVKSWGSGEIPPSGKPDVVGAFRFLCNASHLSRDDPIMYPGQPGASHLHQFFGNTAADANSTYSSLRTTGESTCGNILNRSAYWMPAMLNGRGGVVVPDYVSIYYKRRPASDPECQRQGTACVPIPRGLRFVFGHNMENPSNDAPDYSLWFNCDGPTAKSGHFHDIVEAAVGCPSGNRLGAVINAPDCWNGKDLDSPDHRSHMAYASYGQQGYLKCPATHPYVIPTFTMGVWYTTDDTLDRSGTWTAKTTTWHLSSDEMPGMAPMRPGSTFHSDWFGAWDDDTMDAWTANCIDKLLNCSGGDLGNGKQMKEFAGFTWNASPRVVPVPK